MALGSNNPFPSVLLDEQASDPATPAAGFWRVFAKATGLFIIDDAGAVTGPFTAGDLAAHLADAADAHDASAISADSTTLVGTGTDVQAVLEELDNGIADHLADATAAHAASAISYAGGTGMAATDVEAAIDELATEKADKATFPEVLIIAIGDETTAITTGTAKTTFRMPFAMTLTAVRASLTTVSSSGTPTFDINESGTTVLSTKLTVDASEKTSTTAAVAAVISDAALADDAEITIDVDVAGTGAAGAKITLIGTRSV